MDSPESSKPNTQTEPVQESPVFSYISNLSPIQPLRVIAVSQGFSGLNSPPHVFTSPRLTPHNQTIPPIRSQFLGLSTTESSQHDAGCKNRVTAVNGSEKLDIELSTTLMSCTSKGSDSKSHMEDQMETPKCSDQFLTDVINMDSVDPNVPFDTAVKESKYIDQSLETIARSKEPAVRTNDKHNTRLNEEIAADPPSITTNTEDVNKGDMSIDVSVVERDIKRGDGVSVSEFQEFDKNFPMTELQNVKAKPSGSFDHPSNLFSGTMLIGDESENTVEATGAVLSKHVLVEERNNSEALQFRGIRRRCLQFEDAQHKKMSYCPAQNSSDSEVPETQSLETNRTPVGGKQADTTQPIPYPLYNLNSTIMMPKPSGIGLHLNSIVNTVRAESGGIYNVKSAQRENFRVGGRKFIPMSNSHLSDNLKSSSTLSVSENVTASIDIKMHERHSSEAADSTTSLSTYVKPLINPVILNPVEATPDNKRKYSTENDGGSDELAISISKKKGKMSLDSGDGCKRCNCKKSRCLKLYCDCFAAGIYCVQSCTCQGCFNRPEYEDTVLDTRQQIESRNPLAFAPKVVQPITPPLSISGEDQTLFTPSSARHKRGCNCKKSMCLKKYCECYQSNVGCSEGCRCEGCKNAFGQKGECGMIEDMLSEKYSSERRDASVENFEMLASGTGLYNTELHNPHSLTPVTPALDFSNHRKDASKAWFPSGRYLQSAESGPPFIAPYAMFPGSLTKFDGNGKNLENANENLDLASFDQEIDCGAGETVDKFSASRHQPGDVVSISSMSNPHEWANISKAQSLSGSGQYFSLNSLHWHGSPNTPVVQFSGTKPLRVAEFDSELSNIMQDDTPELLKDSSITLNTVKVSSPNKKRVSPPHGRPVFGSTSPDGLTTAYKITLKAVSPSPPFTPCTDSRIADQQKNDHEL